MSAPRFLSVKNFEQYQHYRDRRPPWIKLYQTVLEDIAFTRLQDASKAQLMLIWLLASRYGNRIPYDAEWVGRAIHATEPVDLDALVSAGLLVICESEQSASKTLAEGKQDAMPKRREKREQKQPKDGAQKAAPWMGDVRAVWRGRYDADPPAQAVKALRPLVERHGVPEVVARLTRYVGRTEARFVDVWRFVATWGEWTGRVDSDPPRGAAAGGQDFATPDELALRDQQDAEALAAWKAQRAGRGVPAAVANG